MTTEQIERAVGYVESWAVWPWTEDRVTIRPQSKNVVVVIRQGPAEAVVTIETDDRDRIYRGLSAMGVRLMRRCEGKRGVRVLGTAGDGRWDGAKGVA